MTLPTLDIFQYQEKTESPPAFGAPIPSFESTFHQPLSTPVRFRVNKRSAVALSASGLVAPVLNPDTQITQFLESRWHYPWSTPVRVKPRLRTPLQPFTGSFFDTTPSPSNLIQGWFQPWRDPVRYKSGLRARLQQTTAAPPRYLPPANVTVTMDATETNTDVALFGVNVYNSVSPTPDAGANVSISEEPANNSGAGSVGED